MSPPSSAVRMRVEDPQWGAEPAQQVGGTGRLGPEGEVLAAEQRLGLAVLHDAVHELFRRHGADLLELGAEVILHPKAGDQGVLVLGGEQTLALHFVVGGQLEGEHRRCRAVGLGPCHSPVDHRTVADVDAVKKAHGDGGAAFVFQRQRRKRG